MRREVPWLSGHLLVHDSAFSAIFYCMTYYLAFATNPSVMGADRA
jgi:hypothetical protein